MVVDTVVDTVQLHQLHCQRLALASHSLALATEHNFDHGAQISLKFECNGQS
jgi:hypothetical protein